MRKLFVGLLLCLFVCSLFVGFVPVVRGATVINSYPYTISSSGDYVVGTGGSTSTAYAITIGHDVDNVYLDGANIQISGSGSNDGVLIWGSSHVTIVNMNLSDFSNGIRAGSIEASSEVLVEDSVFYSCDYSGLVISYTTNSTIRNCTFYANPLYSCLLRYSTDVLVDGVIVYGASTYGIIYDFDCSYIEARNCFTFGCSSAGFVSDGQNEFCTYKDSVSSGDGKAVLWQTDTLQGWKLVSNVNVTNPTAGTYAFLVSGAVNVTIVKCNVVGVGAGLVGMMVLVCLVVVCLLVLLSCM